MAETTAAPIPTGYRKCAQCNVIAAEGRHGTVDCIAEHQRQIKHLRRERNEAQIERDFAQVDLDRLRKVFKEVFDD